MLILNIKKWKMLFLCIAVPLVFTACGGGGGVGATFNASAARKASYSAPVSQNTLPENTLLQFTAGGHILGFKHDRVYFASLDHAIIEEFLVTKGVMPVGESGNVKTEGKKGAPPLGKVIYKNLWQGITLKYEAKDGGIAESTYLLEPEAEVKDIKLKYNVPVGIEKGGTLRFRHSSDKGYFIQSAPKAWQDVDGKRIPVEAAFADYGNSTIGFRLGEYNRQYPVVIDPTYQWHTFYGSTASDFSEGIAVDTNGNVHVIGYSRDTWNGPAAQAPLNAHSGNGDIVVLKLNTAGAYQWHTFYGSASGSGITVDTNGNVHVIGYSRDTWNGPAAQAPLNAHSGYYDIVVLKLNTAGAYQWHTFYGSAASTDRGSGIAVDTNGNVYVTGYSTVTWNGPGATAPLNAHSGYYDIVVLKLNTAGAYQWHTFYGSDSGSGITVDTSGNIYVSGVSGATWNGPGATAPLNAWSWGGYRTVDIVVLKLLSDNPPPTKPTLIYPQNGSTGMPTTLTLKWDKSTDQNEDTITYKLYIGTAPSFTGVDPIILASIPNNSSYAIASWYQVGAIALVGFIFIGGLSKKRRKIEFLIVTLIVAGGLLLGSCGGSGSGGGSDNQSPVGAEVSYTVENLQTGTIYYWKVTADDGNGGVTESDIYSFTTAT
ncbi:MAG: SBBP repeat-containing protein [Nitrospirae bacterium]|nr:SBBP repeat-containing protein [Nitrospirota bacterium]